MATKVYRSNLFAWWRPDRQDAALDEYKPGWRELKVFSDNDLTDRELRGSYQDRLTERAIIQRPSTRKTSDTILVASLAVLAKADADMHQLAKVLASQGAVIESAEDATTYNPKQADKLIAAWSRARTKSRLEGAAKRGGQKSATIRKAASLEGAKRIWDRWKLPSDEHKTADLLAEAGISRNTMNAHYGCTREVAQHRYQASLKRKATKKRQKEGLHA
jgi:DNA invertase Pin-like site-specific DNA recombinase